MKRILSIILIFAISTQLYIYVSAADANSADVSEEKLGLLDVLGIAEEMGENPEYSISRAEFLAWTLAALDERHKVESELPIFNDVTVNHRYYNEIVYAYQKGYISGAGDRRFYPDDYISFEDAGVIMINSMGYKAAANKAGYFNTAAALGLYKSCETGNGIPVTRKAARQMIYNMITADFTDIRY